MMRNLFRQKASQNTRKFYKPNFKLHNTNIVKNKNNILFEEEPINQFIKLQGKYKFLKEKMQEEQKKTRGKLRLEKRVLKSKRMDINEIKKFAENIKFDKTTNVLLGVGFETDIHKLRQTRKDTGGDILKFGDSFSELVEQLGTLNDNELIQFLRHSVALKASQYFENQAKGILLDESIKEEINNRFQNAVEKEKNIQSLVKKLSMKIVYGKIDEILKSKNEGSSYEHNDMIQMILEDPYINPNSFFAQDLLNKIYDKGEVGVTIAKDENPLTEKNLYQKHFQQQYFTARAEVLCSLGDVDINTSIFLEQEEDQEVHSIAEAENRQNKEFKQLTLTLKDILADYTIHNNLNNSIKNLERQLNIYKKDFPSLENIAIHLNQIMQNIPKNIYKKYFNKNQDAEDQSKYINQSYKQEELQWNTVNKHIPCEIMKIDEQEEEEHRLNKMGTIETIQRSYLYYHNSNSLLVHQEAVDQFYEDSDQELDEHTTNAWYEAELNLDRREFDHQATRNLYELNREYLNLMEKKLYLARNPDSQKPENIQPIHLSEVPDELIADEYFHLREKEFEKTNRHSYAAIDKNLFKEEVDDRMFRQVNYFNLLTKKNYDRLWDSKKLQAIRSVLGRDVHGSKLHRYLFHNGQWFIGKKLNWRPNNYRCFDQTEINEYDEFSYSVEDGVQDCNIRSPEIYNDYLQIKYDKFRVIPDKSYIDTDVKLFGMNESIGHDRTFDSQPHYRKLVAYYKESNSSYFYNHYIQTALKEMQLFSKEQKFDMLEQEIDPNYGFYNEQNNVSQYTQEFLESNKNKNLVVKKLNPKLKQNESKLEDLKKLYPNLFEQKDPKQKKDLNAIQIFSAPGSRKTARATAVLKIPGTGKVKVNNREFTEYFFRGDDRNHILKPIKLIDKLMDVDIEYFVHGGNLGSQSDAGKLALARAICKAYPEYTNHFRNLHFLYRDPRTKEAKKINSYGARKSYTYVRR